MYIYMYIYIYICIILLFGRGGGGGGGAVLGVPYFRKPPIGKAPQSPVVGKFLEHRGALSY